MNVFFIFDVVVDQKQAAKAVIFLKKL